MLRARKERSLGPAELAFYGGTFTGQRKEYLEACLAAAAGWMDEGLIACWRCSTRPDCLDRGTLARMAALGCRTVELGIQSFDTAVLAASGRAYTAEAALAAVALVQEAGPACGIQLLPGLPASTPGGFLDDVATGVRLGAALFRFYPCLVLEGTPLAALWRRGGYAPWDVATAVATLSRGLRLAAKARIPVIRIGVAQEPSLQGRILAGPADPDLGTRCRSAALLAALAEAVPQGNLIRQASIPRTAQGYLYGQGGENRAALAKLGITAATLAFTDGEEVVLDVDDGD